MHVYLRLYYFIGKMPVWVSWLCEQTRKPTAISGNDNSAAPSSSFFFFWSTRRGLVVCCLPQVNQNTQWPLHVDETGSREGGLGQQTAVRGKPNQKGKCLEIGEKKKNPSKDQHVWSSDWLSFSFKEYFWEVTRLWTHLSPSFTHPPADRHTPLCYLLILRSA